MSGPDVGTILGYLRLDRSDWDAELTAAGRKADDLARHNPRIDIRTNAPQAIAQLSAVAIAVKRLQDAQGSESVALSRLSALQAKGISDGPKVAAAEEAVAKARRAQALATIQLADANARGEAALQKAAADTDNLSKSADKATSSFKVGLIPALLAVAPAAVPIAGVAGGALVGLIPVAATVALGVKGITDELKSGALAGTKYGADMNQLSGEYTRLKSIAAGGLLSGLDRGLADSHGLFAEVNRDVGIMSGQLGDVVAGAAPALLRILTQLDPLFVTFGTAIADGAQHLEHWAESSSGVSRFVAYVQAELPDVLHVTGELVVLLAHLAEGAAPFGGVLLHDIGAFVGALNAIPIGVLQTAIPLAVALYAAFKAYAGLKVIIGGVATATTKLGAAWTALDAPMIASLARQQAASEALTVQAAQEAARVAAAKATEAEASAEAAVEIAASNESIASSLDLSASAAAESAIEFAAAMRAEATAAATTAEEIATSAAAAAEASETAGAAASVGWGAMLGPIGAVIVGGGLLATMFLHSGKSAQEAAAQVNTYTDAIKADSGALADNTREAVQNSLEKSGAAAAGQKLGISYKLITDAVLGVPGALAQVNAQLLPYSFGVVGATKDTHDQVAAAKLLSSTLGDQSSAVHKAADLYEYETGKLKDSTNATAAQTTAAAALYGLTGSKGVAAYLAAQQAAKQNTQQAQAQTLQYQLENDAASLLAQTLDKLSGKNLGYAQSQNSFDSALSNMGTHVNATGKQITFTTTSIRNMSSASVELRGQLLGQVTSAEQAAESYGKLKGSSEAGRLKLIELRKEIISNAVAHGVDRQAVVDYIDTVLKIPKTVPPTKLDIETARAKAEARAYIAWLRSLPTVTIGVNFAANRQSLINSQVPQHATGASGVPDGYSWVGDPGPHSELLRKQGSRVDVIPHDQAVQFAASAGMNVPSFAKGTAGGAYSFGGIQYASQLAADNAATRAAQKLTKAQDTLSGELPKFIASLGQSTSQLHSAEQTLIKDLRNADASHKQLQLIHADMVQMNGLARQRDKVNAVLGTPPSAPTAYDKLATARGNYNQTASSVAQAFTSGFNILSAGTPDPNAPWVQARQQMGMAIPTQSASSILAALGGQLATDKKFKSELKTLGKEGLSKSLLDQLAQAGPESAGGTVSALMDASKSQINALTLQYGQLQKVGAAAGRQTADAVNGKQLKAAQDTVTELKKVVRKLDDGLARLGKKVDTIGSQVAGAFNGTAHTAHARARGQVH